MKLPHPTVALGIAAAIAVTHHYRSAEPIALEEQLLYITGLALLVISSMCWIVMSGADPERIRRARMPRGVKVSMAAFFLVSALMAIGALVLLPVMGLAAVKAMVGPAAPFLLLGGAVLFLPFIEKRVH